MDDSAHFARLIKFLPIIHWKLAKKDQKSASFSFLTITFDIIKMLTSSFHWWATFFLLNPGIPSMAIPEVVFRVSIIAHKSKNGHLWPLLTFMDTMQSTSNIAMLGIPGLSIKIVAHQ